MWVARRDSEQDSPGGPGRQVRCGSGQVSKVWLWAGG